MEFVDGPDGHVINERPQLREGPLLSQMQHQVNACLLPTLDRLSRH